MSLPNLSPEQFPQFFEAVHGYAPFHWQSRMAAEVFASGVWPEYVALPTAAGKTALIDIAVFALACDAHLPAAERRASLRIFFVIDRRVVADEAFARTEKIADALRAVVAKKRTVPILQTVAARLQHLGGEDSAPLHCALLRGGIALDDTWIRSPLQPTVCVSTVDQVGSRLLFRGYGVSPRQRAIHASLIAHDSLVIVDESHISEPFCATAKAVRKYANRSDVPVIRPLRLVEMTATPPPGQNGFTLASAEESEPELAKRIATKKPVELEMVAEAVEARGQPELVSKAVVLAKKWGAEKPRVIGVVVNRVLTARRIFDALDVGLDQKVLFIGRIRPLDREKLWEKWRAHLISNPKRPAPAERTLFVVATQTIEVGADLDFDALISEIAPIDALRQRFGRLNRLGRPIEVKACIITTKEQTGTRYEDPVYDKTLAPTWKWLQDQREPLGKTKVVNFSHASLTPRLEAATDETRKAMVVAPSDVPLLHRSFLDAWACTAQPLMHDPDVAPFLHGDELPQPEVQVVWRADLDENVFKPNAQSSRDFNDRLNATRELLELLPPSSREALPIPLPTAIRWLQQLASLELTDTSNSRDAEPDRAKPIRPAMIWRSAEEIFLAYRPADIRPGNVLVVPSSYGGADDFGWIGTSATGDPVSDLAEEAAWSAGRAPFLRLHNRVLAQHGVAPPAGLIEVIQAEESDTDWKDWIETLQAVPPQTNGDPDWRERLEEFAKLAKQNIRGGERNGNSKRDDIEVISAPYYSGAILRSRRPRDPFAEMWADDERDEGSQTRRIPLREHLDGVTRHAKRFAAQAGLPVSLAEAVRIAAEFHDLGKADPRLQIIFHGAEHPALAAIKAGTLLAKSGHRFDSRRASRRLYRLAGLPRGARHETLSIFLAQTESKQLPAIEDRDLAIHLIGAHHGYARPLLKPLAEWDDDPDTVDLRPVGLSYHGPTNYEAASLSNGVPDSFLDLQQRYGWWGLAWLETLLRLADWMQSAEEQKPPPTAK